MYDSLSEGSVYYGRAFVVILATIVLAALAQLV